MLLLAGSLQAGHGHAGESHGDHAGAVVALDLERAASVTHEAAVDRCALAPGCVLGLPVLPPADAEPRLEAVRHPFDMRRLTGLSGRPNPHPPRLPQA